MSASINIKAAMERRRHDFPFPRWRRGLGPVGLTCSFSTGSKSLDDITAGSFLVIVINGAAGSSETDDSWQK